MLLINCCSTPQPSCDVSILHRQGSSPKRKREYHSVWDCNKETLQELGRGVKLPKPILEKIHWVKQSFPYHGGYDEARDLAAAFVLGPGEDERTQAAVILSFRNYLSRRKTAFPIGTRAKLKVEAQRKMKATSNSEDERKYNDEKEKEKEKREEEEEKKGKKMEKEKEKESVSTVMPPVLQGDVKTGDSQELTTFNSNTTSTYAVPTFINRRLQPPPYAG